ncbi:MAG: glycosyltransferase [Chthoniobacterales bacterium]|nr:glycosyltransferase [Chthoniobacterales bacterium]
MDWLRLAIASVADQEGVEIEHLIQDGGTEGIHEAVAAATTVSTGHHDRPQLFVEKDDGMYDAINRGLKRTRGEICCYLNCDEQYLPGTLTTIAHYFAANPKVDVLFADAILVNDKGTPISYRRVTLPSLAHLRQTSLNTLTCATFFRRRILEAGHFFPTALKIAGDQAWVFQMLKSGVRMDVLHEPVSVFTFTGANLSHTAAANEERFGWLSPEEKPRRWLAPLVIARHRFGKLLAGAYRNRSVTIEIYTLEEPELRRKISARIGFRWPKAGVYSSS